MTIVTLPFRTELQGGQAEDIGMVLADFDAILAVLNGDIRNDNIAAAAAIAISKLAIGGTPDGTKVLRDDATWAATAAASFALLGDSLLGADTASIDLQNLPTTSKHLRWEFYGRTDRAASDDDLGVRFNNDSGANYYNQKIRANTAAITSSEGLGTTSGSALNGVPGNSATANFFGGGEGVIQHYAGTTNKKVCQASFMQISSVASGNLNRLLPGWLWNSAAAISRITFFPTGGGTVLKAGSRGTAYGF